MSIIIFILISCQNGNNQSNNLQTAEKVNSIKYFDYINSLPISKLPHGFPKILSQNEVKSNDDSVDYNWVGAIDKYYLINYHGARTYDICLCNSVDVEEEDSFYIFKRLKPINDTIETLLLLEDKSGKLDMITLNKYDQKIIDSLNLWDSYQGDFSIFKLFYIAKDYKITLKSFWSYEDDGHANPFERSKCEYVINENGKIISFYNQHDGIANVKLESGDDLNIKYDTLFSGEIKNHLKNGKWVEKQMTNTFLHVVSGEYVDGIKKGQWIYNQYSSNKVNVTIDSDLSELYVVISDTIIY